MKASTSIIGIFVAIALSFVVVLAGSHQGIERAGLPLFAWIAVIIFAIQWVVFIPSWFAHSEHFFDLTGSVTYLVVVVACLSSVDSIEPRSLLIGAMVSIWALRLGWFLSTRVRAAGSDSRFDVMKHRFVWFLMTWTLQGLWILVTCGAALAAMSRPGQASIGPTVLLGTTLWATGFAIEVAADSQKRRFRSKVENHGRFIATGLWAYSRHPNYFGEILLWVGVAVAAMPALSSWAYATLVSPLFVWALLTRISGIPLLETASDRRWGGQEDYETYKAHTPTLMFRLGGFHRAG